MKVVSIVPDIHSTAVEHVGKHFDLVLGVDIHWTKLPFPPFPLPLPHPFIGFIFDPMEYVHFEICVPGILQQLLKLPAKLPMGASVYVHGRIKATTTTSVFGFGCTIKPKNAGPLAAACMVGKVIPIKHITGGLPFYKIFFGDLEGPHDGEIYIGSNSVILNGSECSGSSAGQVLTCWGSPFGHQYFPPAWLSLYQHILTLYVQLNFKPPVLVGGRFVPHQYSLSDILMRAAAVFLMKGLTILARKGLTRFNHLLQGKFGSRNPVSRALCFFGLEPVNFVTGAMNFCWDDFELLGDHTIRWTSAWQSDISYCGILGNGVLCNYDLFIIPQFVDGVAAYNNPLENQVFPIPIVEVGSPEEYYRPLHLWQHRPDARTWIIRTVSATYTYRAFPDREYGLVYRAVRIAYAAGGFIVLDYDRDTHLLSTLSDHVGRLLVFGQDTERGLILSATYKYEDISDLLVVYEYDESRNLRSVSDRFGKSISFTYDEHNRVVRRQNRNGMSYTWSYDDAGRVVHTSGDGGVQEGRITYLEGCNEVIYPGTGGRERYYYDEHDLVYKKVDALGGETWYGYDAWQERTLVGTAEGKVSKYEYDTRGNLVKFTASDGSEYTSEYDTHNRLMARTSPLGNREEWGYDAEFGRLVFRKESDGTVVRYTYEADNGRPSAIEYGDGLRVELQYNALGLLSVIKDSFGVQQTRTYDAYGRPLTYSHGDGTHTQWRRDRLGRVTRYAAPGQRVLHITYDAYDLPVELTSGNECWNLEYTALGSLLSQTRRTRSLRKVSSVHYTYDAYDRLRSVENELGERYLFGRDLNGSVILEKGFDGSERRYDRDLDGTVIKTHLPDGTIVHHQHDQAGRLTYNRYADGSWEAWEYDKGGLLTKAYNADSVTEFVHNAIGQVVKETQDGQSVEHVYDARSRLARTISGLGADLGYGYDLMGLSDSITARSSGSHRPWEVRIERDRLGRETHRRMTGGIESAYFYDTVGRPCRQRVMRGEHRLYDRSYGWGDDFRLLETLNTITGARVRYDYDAFGRLSEAEYGAGFRQYRTTDAMGNVYASSECTDRTYGRGGQLRQDGTWHYHYDAQGNLVLKTKRRIDPSCGFESVLWHKGDYAYVWQANGMLRSVTRPDGKTVTFKYDALGRRKEKRFDGKIHRYLWDGNVVLHEWAYAETDSPQEIITEDGRITFDRSEPADNVITWVYDTDSYVPTAKIENGKTYSIVSDYIGRPVQAYDECGTVVWQADYDIYGNLRNLRGDREFIPFRQVGQYEDAQTGLYYNRFRYYDPNIGNYISQDPIGLAGNNPTMYGYVRNINVNFDLWGLFLSLPASSVKNPWKEGEIIRSIIVPEGGMEIDMAMAPGQTRTGSWGTIDKITDVDFVRNKLAVTPEFKPEISHVQRYRIPEGTRVQVGIAGPQEYKGVRYEGGGQQVELLNYEDRAKLEPIGKPRGLNYK